MRLPVIALLFLTFLCTCVRAQILTGTVYDATSEAPLPFVYLQVSDAALGTVTEADGTFRLNVPAGLSDRNLVFSYLGYQTVTRKIADLRAEADRGPLALRLRPEATELAEITVTPKKLPSARAILRRALNAIDKNYPVTPTLTDGYYRESMKENGVYIKYTDAAVTYRAEPYQQRKYRWKAYTRPYDQGSTLSGIMAIDPSETLHRSHFHFETLKKEQARIIDSRASLNGSTRRMNGNIIGGPLSLLGRDRVKYQEAFLGKKRYKDFTYLVDEERDENGRWVYVLHFHTTTTKALLEEYEKLEDSPKWRLKNKMWQYANRHKLLAGKIYVDPDSYAILRYECHVPNELKRFFCGYKAMAIKHFDYKLDVRYKKQTDGRYALDYLRHENEFIFKDTIKQTTTPYAAISEFWAGEPQLTTASTFPATENFANTNFNQLYDYALEYDSVFWADYLTAHPQHAIPAIIRQDMEAEKTLEEQFVAKQTRDENMPAPVAPIHPSLTELHGDKLTDDYAWLKDTRNPKANDEVMDYLAAENDYAENYFLPLRKLQRQVFSELSNRMVKNYKSQPTKKDGYFYHYEYREDLEHPIYFRAPVAEPTRQDTLIDVNKEAEKYDGYYDLGGISFSPDNNLMAYGENTTGSDKYVVRFKRYAEDQMLPDSLENIGGITWIDNETLLYTQLEKKTFRAHKIMRHRLGTAQSADELVYHEMDPLYGASVGKSKSKDFIFLSSGSNDASEVRYLRTDDPGGQFKVFKAREDGISYGVSHHGGQFYILTNESAPDGQLFVTDTNRVERRHWKKLVPGAPGVLLTGYTVFDNYLVVAETERMESRLRVIDRRTNESHVVKHKGESIYNIGLANNPDTDTDSLRYATSSFTDAGTTYAYHMGTREKRLVREEPKQLQFGKLMVKREWATAPDGTEVPITLIYDKWRSNGTKSKKKRVYLTAYGSYGASSDASYSNMVNTLIARGFVYAIAHVRGGGELGRAWYDGGRMLRKENTFTDFIACAEHLITEGYAERGSITAQGGSAGGLLMGAVANMRPELFKAIFLDVPFVDVINTMLDDKLPLTTGEYLEWGDPHKKKYYNCIRRYSPYENVKAQAYPPMFFSTGLKDSRVGYWEPAKMVAKLRRMKTDDNILLLNTNLSAGHGGASGRYAAAREAAYKLALLFDLYAAEESDSR